MLDAQPRTERVATLQLDAENPRFGEHDGQSQSQTDILDHIVATFGVDDVLSSLAVNGYFRAEPLLCRRNPSTNDLVVSEGNRRLVACLMLTGDERAANHKPRAARFRAIHAKHGSPPIDPVPIIQLDADADRKQILSYLGVRHIASAQQWDSFAKAVWIARVVRETDLDMDAIAEMIGDRYKTVTRLLQGYSFVHQLIDKGVFRPEDSVRSGRGSNTLYPFSWVYTILDYRSVREYLNLNDDPTATNPVPDDHLDDASLLIVALFGNRARGRSSALTDSRQLGDLAAAVSDPAKIRLLRSGKTLNEIDVLTMPLDARLAKGLLEARENLGDLNTRLTEQDTPAAMARRHTGQSERVERLAGEVHRKLKNAAADG
ncbi:MAG: hypothetical protein OXI50_16125 [Gammaproteobacteria bacterium]|nr:hypothetical protein [Gammaproteobacteria bacterium]